MTKRVRVEPTIPVAQPVGLSEMVALMAALEPPKTNAHDTDEQTPCRVCGGPCPARSPHWGPWRQHPQCQTVAGDQIGRLQAASKALGHALDRQDAALTPFRALTYAETHPEPTWGSEPLRERLAWRHLDRAALYAALERLPGLRIEAGLVETRCTDGPCAWCGVLESKGWSSHGHTWADGTQAPLCGSCSTVYERNGSPSPTYWAEQRAGIAEAATDSPTMTGEHVPDGIRAYAEVEDVGKSPHFAGSISAGSGTGPEADQRSEVTSDGTPWSHLPGEALERYRWDRWMRSAGRYAPVEHRQEAAQRARAAEAAWSARAAARLAAEAAKQDTYGFGRSA